ncbi:MAG TPA: hypothetical protein VLK88_10880, partial [Gemmatimonadales bacterium]|nr:hypothetical protein [Gemmatimonadales bacterium]
NSANFDDGDLVRGIVVLGNDFFEAAGVNQLRRPDNATILVTHYQRLLNYIVPDVVHVLAGGRIVKSGGKELALELEAKGYDWLTGGPRAA